MKRYYVDSVIEGKSQTNEVNKEAYEQLKVMGDTFPLRVYKEPQMGALNENGEVIDPSSEVQFEIIDIPFTLRVEDR